MKNQVADLVPVLALVYCDLLIELTPSTANPTVPVQVPVSGSSLPYLVSSGMTSW